MLGLTTSVLLLSLVLYFFLTFQYSRPPPSFPTDGYFGEGNVYKDDEEVYPYTLSFDDNQIARLQHEYGTLLPQLDLGSVEAKVSEYLKSFDWNIHKHFLNSLEHFRTEVEGVQYHFVHSCPRNKKDAEVFPLLILPSSFSSFWNYFKLISILSNPQRYGFDFGSSGSLSFCVVVPSYPGTTLSPSAHKDIALVDISRQQDKLMHRLGYSSYIVYGDGGIGSEISTIMSSLFPSHISSLIVRSPPLYLTGYRYKLQEYILATDIISTKNEQLPVFDGSLSSYFLYHLRSWSSSPLQHSTLAELAISTALFSLTDSFPSHINLIKSSSPISFQEATIHVPSYVISPQNDSVHFPLSLLRHKFMNIAKYDILDEEGGTVFALRYSPLLAKLIFSFVEINLAA